MPRLRPAAAALVAALAMTPSALGLHAQASAVPPELRTSYCSRDDHGTCSFPDFAVTGLPDLAAGRTITVTGVGATLGLPNVEAATVRGGFSTPDPKGGEAGLEPVNGTVEADGTWSVTMTVPDQGIVDRFKDLEIWFDVGGPDGTGVQVLHQVKGPVSIPRTPAPEQPSDPSPMRTGWYQADGNWFWADGNGVQAKGWRRIGESWYLFDTATAAMRTGWVRDGGSWYYLASSGAMATGWVRDGGSWYYLASSGAMATGWVRDGGSWYYLTPSGAMATGWVRDGGSWYYLTPSGAMATGWLVVDGRWSLFAPNGTWQHYG